MSARRTRRTAEQALAVGMFYVEQKKQNPRVVYHWEQQSTELRLHYLAKAKQLLAQVCGVEI